MFGIKKRRKSRCEKFELIKKGKSSKIQADIEVTLLGLTHLDAICKEMTRLQTIQLEMPEIFVDHDYEKIAKVDLTFTLGMTLNMTDIFILLYLDHATYGMDALRETYGVTEDIFTYTCERLVKFYRFFYTYKEIWKICKFTCPMSLDTLNQFKMIAELIIDYVPRHREAYDAYLNREISEKEYNKKKGAIASEIELELYRLYEIDIESLKILSPDYFTKAMWQQPGFGNKEEYEKLSKSIWDISDKKYGNMNYYCKEVFYSVKVSEMSMNSKIMEAEGKLDRLQDLRIIEEDTIMYLDFIGNFVDEAMRSRDDGFERIWKYKKTESEREKKRISTLREVADSYYIAENSIESLLCLITNDCDIFNNRYDSEYSLIQSLRNWTESEDSIKAMFKAPGTEHLFTPEYCKALINIIEEYQERYRDANKDGQSENNEAVDMLCRECMQKLCNELKLDWFEIMEKYPEETKNRLFKKKGEGEKR